MTGDEETPLTGALADAEAQAAVDEALIEARITQNKLLAERATTRRLRSRIGELEDELSVASRFPEVEPPDWTPRRSTKRAHHATPVLMLSDLHLDEVVNPDEVEGLNAYNREIAEARLSRVVDYTVDVCERYFAGLTYDGIVVPLGGDMITGEIHEELAETNEAPSAESVVYWCERLCSAIAYLADEFGRAYLPCVDGNHDRNYKRKRSKRRARSAWTWVLYNFMARRFADDDRVSFDISESSDLRFSVYETRFLLTHGDEGFSGGNGIAGHWSPVSRGHARKQQRDLNAGREWDVLIMGHWHQLTYGPGFIVNGSLKGYDEYAFGKNFPYERPQQALFIVTPENGITMRTSVYG